MTKTTNLSHIGFLSVGIILSLLFVATITTPKAQAAITSQLDLGAKGSNVTQLQQFLASNPLIYPAGLVTGYFGPLTQAAVVQFQATYGITQVGRVGPTTQAKLNNLMSSGYGLDTSVPVMANSSVQIGTNNVTVGWTTNESAQGQVYYDTIPLQLDEVVESGYNQVPFITGISAPNNTGARTVQSVSVQGLQPNTLYYYVNRAIDNSGNITMTLPKTFRTNY